MKLLELTLDNIASLAGTHTIDLTHEPWHSAPLLPITGGEEAQQIMLWDVICLALYNRTMTTPHTHEAAEDVSYQEAIATTQMPPQDVRRFVFPAADSARIALTFCTDKGMQSVITWQVKRLRPGVLGPISRTLQQVDPIFIDFEPQEIPHRIMDTLGTFESFVRRHYLQLKPFDDLLLLQQGHLSDTLIESIVDTHDLQSLDAIVEQQTKALTAEEDAAKAKLQGLSHYILDVPDAQRTTNDLQLCTTQLRIKTEELLRINAYQKWYVRNQEAATALKAAEDELNETKRQLMLMQTQRGLITRRDEVLEVMPLLSKIKFYENLIDNCKKEEHRYLGTVEKQLEHVARQRQEAETDLTKRNEIEKQILLQQPSLNKAFVLQGTIAQKQTEITRLEQQLNLTQRNLEEKQLLIEQNNSEQEALQKKSILTKQQIQALQVHKRLFDKYDFVQEKLKRLHFLTQHDQLLRRKSTELNIRLQEIRNANTEISDKQLTLMQQRSRQQEQMRLAALRVEGNDIISLQNTFTERNVQYQKLLSAKGLWLQLAQMYEEIEELKAMIQRKTAAAERNAKVIEGLKKEIIAIELRHEQNNMALLLGQSENTVQLRQHLKEGTSCPVCGGTHHPYHTETAQELGELGQTLAQNVAQSTESLQQKSLQMQQLRETLARDNGRKEALQTQLMACQERVKQAEDLWRQYASLDSSMRECSPMVNRQARMILIEQMIDNAVRACKETTLDLQIFNEVQQQKNDIHLQMQQDSVENEQLKEQLQNFQVQIASLQAVIQETQEQITKNASERSETFKNLDALMTITAWMVQWKENHDALQMKIEVMAKQWRTLEETAIQEEAQLHTLVATQGLLNTVQADLEKRKEYLAQLLQERITTLEETEAELKQLVGYHTPQEVHRTLHDTLHEAKNKTEASTHALHEAESQYNMLEGILQSARERLSLLQETLLQEKAKLDVWMRKFNGEHSPIQRIELESLYEDGRNWNALRDQLSHLDEDFVLAQKRFQQAHEKFLHVQSMPQRPTEREEDKPGLLIERSNDIKTAIKEVEEKISNLKLRLAMHTYSENVMTNLHDKIEELGKQRLQWKTLQELLQGEHGDSMLKRLQLNALTRLFTLANHYLQRLNTHYALHLVPQTMCLEVLDTHRLMASCDTTALSAMDRYCLSMALALSCSALQDSKQQLPAWLLLPPYIFEGLEVADQTYLIQLLSTLMKVGEGQMWMTTGHATARLMGYPQLCFAPLADGHSHTLMMH